MHFQWLPLTLRRTVLMESLVLHSLGVIFKAKIAFKKHLSSVSTAASHRLVILGKSS